MTGHTYRPTSLDQQFVDFDGVRYHMTSTDKKTVLLLSMEWPCIAQLNAFGANELLSREYGFALLPADQTEQGYDVSLVINLEELPEDPGALAPVLVPLWTLALTCVVNDQRPGPRRLELIPC